MSIEKGLNVSTYSSASTSSLQSVLTSAIIFAVSCSLASGLDSVVVRCICSCRAAAFKRVAWPVQVKLEGSCGSRKCSGKVGSLQLSQQLSQQLRRRRGQVDVLHSK